MIFQTHNHRLFPYNLDPSFYCLTMAIGTFASLYILFYAYLPMHHKKGHSRYLFAFDDDYSIDKILEDNEKAVVKLKKLKDAEKEDFVVPDSSEIEDLLSKLLSLIHQKSQSNSETFSKFKFEPEQQLDEESAEMLSYSSEMLSSADEQDVLNQYSQLLLNFSCPFELGKDSKVSMIMQHRVSKTLTTLEKVGDRFLSCGKYYKAFYPFLKVGKNSKNRLKFAYIHNIKHHVDVALLELFLLTYDTAQDYHCVHLSPELNGETPLILKEMVNCLNEIWGKKRIILANLAALPLFWRITADSGNPEVICLRELLEFQSDWHYVITKSRHSLPLLSRMDLERQIVERIHGMSYLNLKKKSHFIGAAFQPPLKEKNAYILPDDHVVILDEVEQFHFLEWTLDSALISWNLVNHMINDLTYSAMKSWLNQPPNKANETEKVASLAPKSRITITTTVESTLETSKRFILQRYLSPGYRPRTKRNDFMGLCNGQSNSLWWNAVDGGCPESSDRKWCFLRLADLDKAYSNYNDECFFSNRFNIGAHPTSAICHSFKLWKLHNNFL